MIKVSVFEQFCGDFWLNISGNTEADLQRNVSGDATSNGMESNWERKGLIGKLLKLSKCSEFSAGVKDSRKKLDHSQLPMQKKVRLEENIFKFLRNVLIRLQKESR